MALLTSRRNALGTIGAVVGLAALPVSGWSGIPPVTSRGVLGLLAALDARRLQLLQPQLLQWRESHGVRPADVAEYFEQHHGQVLQTLGGVTAEGYARAWMEINAADFDAGRVEVIAGWVLPRAEAMTLGLAIA